MRVLGLDIGVTSVGWAIVDTDNDEKSNNKILHCGVRLFDGIAIDAKGKPQSQLWSSSKSLRNRFRRKRERLNGIIKEFQSIGFIDSTLKVEDFFKNFHKNIYELRAKAAKEQIAKDEIFACIYHIAKHRGYRQGVVTQGDRKTAAIIQTKEKMRNDDTFASYLMKIAKSKNSNPNYTQYRNRSGKTIAMADKKMIEYEAKKILETQSKFYGGGVRFGIYFKNN